jgi:hypothetical protein
MSSLRFLTSMLAPQPRSFAEVAPIKNPAEAGF